MSTPIDTGVQATCTKCGHSATVKLNPGDHLLKWFGEIHERLLLEWQGMHYLLTMRPTSDDADHEVEEWEALRTDLLAEIVKARPIEPPEAL